MKITRVSGDLYKIPVHREMHDAVREFSVMDLVFARIETDEGFSGCGFTYSIIPHGGLEIRSVINSSIDPLVRGLDPRDHERVWVRMWRRMDWVGRGGIVAVAIAATDIASWDLKSKMAGQPLNKLLGSSRDKVPVYNTDGGWLNHSLEQLVEETKKIVAAGFRGIAIPNGLFVEYIPSLDAVLKKPLALEDGYFTPSQAPGLGIEWDPNKLDTFKAKP